MSIIGAAWALIGAAAGTGAALAQAVAPIQSVEAARAQDAAAVADRLGVPVDEAVRQLRLQEASVAATDALADRYAARLAGIAIDHRPAFRIVVTLTGDAPVADETLDVDGSAVPVTFHTGARATHVGMVQAITAYQAAIRNTLLQPPGMGIDPRTGEIVIVVSGRDIAREGHDPLRDRLAMMTGMPVRLRVVDQPTLDLGDVRPATGIQGAEPPVGGIVGNGIQGGTRVIGQVAGDSHRYLCTSAFVVTDGTQTGLATAAHCPDDLTARDTGGQDQLLPFVGQWGWGNQDVQINASAVPLPPLFFADTARTISRPVTAARSRSGMRAGDVVCHRGERTGYSCSTVELTDFAPAGDLCGGACLPTWTTVAGPTCRSGDSGSPVFLGDTAYGILKGGSYRSDGSCAFYFFMSVDYLPAGWRLLMTGTPAING